MIELWCPLALPSPLESVPGFVVHDTEMPPPGATVLLAPPGEEWPRWQRAFPHLAVVVQAEGADAVAALAAGADNVVNPQAPAELTRTRVVRAAQSRAVERELSELRDQLFESRDVLQRVLMLGPDPVVASDLDGRILLFSEAATRFFGYDADHVIERVHVTDLYADPTLASEVLEQLHKMSRDDPQHAWTGQLKARTRSGDAIPVELHAGLLRRGDGVVYGSLGVFRDLRERRDLERRLERSAQDLLDAEERARTPADDTRAAALKQPLTAALGWVEILEEAGSLTSEDLSRISQVAAQLKRLARSIDELLTRDEANRWHN